jgi:hypothetical protein
MYSLMFRLFGVYEGDRDLQQTPCRLETTAYLFRKVLLSFKEWYVSSSVQIVLYVCAINPPVQTSSFSLQC